MPQTNSSEMHISLKQETISHSDEIQIDIKPGFFHTPITLTRPKQDHSQLKEYSMDDKSEDDIIQENDIKKIKRFLKTLEFDFSQKRTKKRKNYL